MFAQQLVNGLTLGCIYALTALSFTLIFGAIRLINFALGELLMLGAFFAIGIARVLAGVGWLESNPILSTFLIIVISIIGAMAIGILMELAAFRPLRRKRDVPILLGLISSLGVSIFLRNFILIFVDSGQVNFPVLIPKVIWDWGILKISSIQVVVMASSFLLMIGLHYTVYHTKLGKEIRAVRDNRDLARQQGTNVNWIVCATFILASGLAAFAGIMMGIYYEVAKYDMGFVPAIKGFTAAILGGVGDVLGGMLGGILIGLVESLGGGYISAEYKDVFAFIVLIVVLLFRPRGLLNRGIQ